MRIVAKVQFTTWSVDETIREQIAQVLGRWRDRKFEGDEPDGFLIRQSGVPAQIEVVDDRLGDQTLDRLTTLEPIARGCLQTEIHVFTGAGRTAFRCVLSVGSDGGVAPADVTLGAPRFVRDIVALRHPWTIGVNGERVFGHSFAIDADDIDELDELITAPERRLPVVIISEFDGETLAGDLHERLSQDLCGLAHVVRLSTGASWELTRRKGREWSCYNGAVRLLWPFSGAGGSDNPFGHPLWTLDQMRTRVDSAVQARDRIRPLIARRILEASTFVADDPIFRDFETAKLQVLAEEARKAASDGGDMKGLADLFAQENDVLRARVTAQDKEIASLLGNVESLKNALRAIPELSAGEQVAQVPPQTVAESVARAREQFAGRVVIASETDGDIAELSPTAGPPDKVFRHLATLADMADEMSKGPLGRSVPIWLREHNVECSVDSETTKASKEGKRFRHRTVDGESVECEFHSKPSDGTSPDKCVRIYFAVSPTAPHVRVGYIGRHGA